MECLNIKAVLGKRNKKKEEQPVTDCFAKQISVYLNDLFQHVSPD